MDPFLFPPIAASLTAAYWVVDEIATLLEPLAGGASAALAIVVLTLLVRTALIPVGVSQVKAEWTRRRLAPKLQALQKKYKGEQLQRKIAALYKAENASPFAGILPTLAQAPVISLVYALFIRATIDGHANTLLIHTIFGTPLGASLLMSGFTWPGIAVIGMLLLVIAAAAWVSRRVSIGLAGFDTSIRPSGLLSTSTAAPSSRATQPAGTALLSWLPFVTVVFAAFVPLAAGLYLAVTTWWTLGERALLRRRYWV